MKSEIKLTFICKSCKKKKKISVDLKPDFLKSECCNNPQWRVLIPGNDNKLHYVAYSKYLSFKRNGIIKVDNSGQEVFYGFEEIGRTSSTLKTGKPSKDNNLHPLPFDKIVSTFLDKYPIHYDRSKLLWRWDKDDFVWVRIDDIDLSISLKDAQTQGLFVGKFLMENILEEARRRTPKTAKPTWIQCKDKIYDFVSGEVLRATPEFFITNPIPYKLGRSDKTPKIDQLFDEWVGKAYRQTLYEIVAYCLTSNKFMQRLFALVGGGTNGKSTFIRLIERLIGEKNCASSELKLLTERNFETAALYKKLLCIIGEVSYKEISNSAQIKRLTGEDKCRFEFKGRQPFSEDNTCTILCATNSLPKTPDKSIGFYRRWLIVDFPNRFEMGRDPLERIPLHEYENLIYRCLGILRDLYSTKKFTNEGTLDERAERYEERSNPVMKFVEKFCDEEAGGNLSLRVLADLCNKYFKQNHLRVLTPIQIGKVLREEGYEVVPRKVGGVSMKVIMNLRMKNKKLPKLPKLPKFQVIPYIATSSNSGSSGSSSSNLCVKCGSGDAFIVISKKLFCKECAHSR